MIACTGATTTTTGVLVMVAPVWRLFANTVPPVLVTVAVGAVKANLAPVVALAVTLPAMMFDCPAGNTEPIEPPLVLRLTIPVPALMLESRMFPVASRPIAPPPELMLDPTFMVKLVGGSISILPPCDDMMPVSVSACPFWL